MATDKDKGVVGAATDRLRETTGALRGEGPWYSTNSEVYHNNPNCQTGTAWTPKTFARGRVASPFAGSASA
jgi:hypothetical protein